MSNRRSYLASMPCSRPLALLVSPHFVYQATLGPIFELSFPGEGRFSTGLFGVSSAGAEGGGFEGAGAAPAFAGADSSPCRVSECIG